MPTLDTILVVTIILFIILLVWSRVMDQSMLDTLREIKEFISEVFGGAAEQ